MHVPDDDRPIWIQLLSALWNLVWGTTKVILSLLLFWPPYLVLWVFNRPMAKEYARFYIWIGIIWR